MPGLCVSCLPAISTFQRHSTQHPLHYRPPFGFYFCFRSAPFRICSTYWVWRLRVRLPTPGLVGSPHLHSSCLAPVSFAGVNVPPPAAPPGSRPGFCPLQVCLSGYLSQKKRLSQPGMWFSPLAHGPVLRLFLLFSRPHVVVARAQAFRPF
jgi:hypothetical protein